MLCLGAFMPPSCLFFFLEFCSLSFGTYFFTASFWVPPCACFYVLGGSSTSLRLGRGALSSRSSMDPNGTVTWAKHSRGDTCVDCVCPLISVELWLMLAHQWIVSQADRLEVPLFYSDVPVRGFLQIIVLWILICMSLSTYTFLGVCN